jgi:bifunctional non-homologous end joining protein LigD
MPFGTQTNKSLSKEIISAVKRLPHEEVHFYPPMKAMLAKNTPSSADWTYEIKFDGYRFIAIKKRSQVRIISRNGHDWTDSFAHIVKAIAKLPCQDVVLDGEVVVLDQEGRSSFQLLQNAFKQQASHACLYYIFDVINLEDHDLRSQELDLRRLILFELIKNAKDPLRLSAPLMGNPDKILKEVARLNLEGLIAKRAHSLYESGRRSLNWLKLKINREQEFVIGGYSEPQGVRACFGSLLVGVYEGKNLHFISKVGTGFDTDTLNDLFHQFQPLMIPQCPFTNLPTPPRRNGGVSRSEMKRCHWLKPKLVCQVRFTEWTQDDSLRHPVYLGLRIDKNVAEVVREKPIKS